MGSSNESTVITFAIDSDFTIIVKGSKDEDGTQSVTEFEVKQAYMVEKSEYFAASLRFNQANGHSQVVLEGDNIQAMYIWLACFHGVPLYNLWTRPLVQDADIETIWHLISACDKYQFDGNILRPFFLKWYNENVTASTLDCDFAAQVAMPFHFFDHIMGFARTTKYLAYNNEGHIRESKPKGFRWAHLHLCPPDFVGE